MNILDKIMMKKLDEKLKSMNDKKLRRVQYISLIVAILGELGILVVCLGFDNTFGHILSGLSLIIIFYLILGLIDDISNDIDMDKRLKKRRNDFNNKIIKLNDYKKYKKGE